MISLIPSSFRRAALAVLLGAGSAFAGTPLICHPYAIGDARTLPGGPGRGVDPAYDRKNLTRDTLALLTPEMPILVRMETLRRAAIYATNDLRDWDKDAYTARDRATAQDLFNQLRARTTTTSGAAQALALFDAGFFVETLKHARLDLGVDGYPMIVTALGQRGGKDPEIEFALALASSWPRQRKEHPEHLARAQAGARPDTLLAANLASHFGKS